MSSQALIITLGRVRRPDASNGQERGSYRTLRYGFSETEVSEPTAFFGQALYRHLTKHQERVDRIVVLGTRGSMWDAMLEIDDNALLNDDANERLFDSLLNQAQAENVDDTLLAELSEALERHFRVPVLCKAIPYGQSPDEQIDILRCFREVTEGVDSVVLDVTHGLRHLPMVALVSAFLLGNDSSPVRTAGVYYGAAELRQGGDVAPVVKLDGLLSLQEWVEAMAVQKTSGNVSRLARIPGLDRELSEALTKYQFFEQMNNVTQARGCAQKIRGLLARLPSEGQLFKDELDRAFDWSDCQKLPIRQYRQARNAFENGDYMRSVVLLTEAMISAHVGTGKDILNYDVREAAKGELDKQCEQNWILLRNLRNTLAHGGQAEGRLAGPIQRMRSEEDFFRRQMDILLKWAERFCS